MALVRWAPARNPYPMHTDINRLFTTLFDTATPVTNAAAPSRRFAPAMDILESDQDYVLRVDLPGLGENDVKLEILEGVLTLSGERRSSQDDSRDGYRRIERSTGSFSRSVTLPKGVDATAVTAQFENGVLEIHIPKPEEKKPQAVEIKVGSADRSEVVA